MAARSPRIQSMSIEDTPEQGHRKDSTDGLSQKIHEQLRRHRYLQVLFFIIILALDTVDLVADWLFYADVSIAEQGLVYGIPDQGAVIALLFFSIVGSITFIFETTNLGKEIFTGVPWFNTDLISAIILWVEDIPQISINVYIAVCREDPISVFQLTKAAVVILGIIIRIIISFVRYCSHESLVELKQRSAESCRHVTYRVFIMLGLMINMAGGIAIFIFTQTTRDLNGNVLFEVPDTIFEDRFHDARYFHNVSVYFHHPTFDYSDSDPNDTNINWMRLITINSIRNLPEKTILFDYEFQDLTNELKMVLWESDGLSSWNPQECYTLDKVTKIITNTVPCDASFISAPPETSIIFQFSFTPPDRIFRKLVFGDITFNVKINENGTCRNVDGSNITDDFEKGGNYPVAVHYYRTNTTEANHIINEGGIIRFYKSDTDLIDIREVWQTGWMNCESKGSIAPHINTDLEPPCSTT